MTPAERLAQQNTPETDQHEKDFLSYCAQQTTSYDLARSLERRLALAVELLEQARDRSSGYGMVDLPQDIDAALPLLRATP